MRKLSLALILAVFAATLFVSTSPASAKSPMTVHTSTHVRCSRGSHWVAAHRGPKGRWVKAYCQKNR